MSQEFIEKITNVAVGFGALSLGEPSGGIVAASATSGVFVYAIGRWNNCLSKEIKKVTRQVLRKHGRLMAEIPKNHLEAIVAVEQIIVKEAPKIIVSPILTNVAFRKRGFVTEACTSIMDQLGILESEFPEYAVNYARSLIQHALSEAMKGEKFFKTLTLNSIIEQSQRIGDIVRTVSNTSSDVNKILKILESQEKNLPPKKLLIEILEKFGVSASDIPDLELTKFIDEIAREYKELKTRFSELEKNDERIKDISIATQVAIDSGDFIESDHLLAKAEEMQEEHTQAEIAKLVDIKKTRALVAILANDTDSATLHFDFAISILSPIDSRRKEVLDFFCYTLFCNGSPKLNTTWKNLFFAAWFSRFM